MSEVDDGNIADSAPIEPVLRLADLFDGMTPEAMHQAFDWGDDVGRQLVDE